jgi:hypothetical protein
MHREKNYDALSKIRDFEYPDGIRIVLEELIRDHEIKEIGISRKIILIS